jgi:hypothetical protein
MTRCTQILLAVVVLAPGPRALAQSPEPLTEAVRAAILEALADERLGEAVYARVLKDHGDVRPFSNVVRAERRHAEFLEALLTARGLSVPAAAVPADVPAYAGVKEACVAAVEFETKNVALYDRLLTAGATAGGAPAAGPLPEDVKRAFEHNRMASLDHHKPAFERCSGVASARGPGRGAGRDHPGNAASQEAHGCGHGGCGHGCGHGRCGGHGSGPRCGHGGGHGHARGGSVQGL